MALHPALGLLLAIPLAVFLVDVLRRVEESSLKLFAWMTLAELILAEVTLFALHDPRSAFNRLIFCVAACGYFFVTREGSRFRRYSVATLAFGLLIFGFVLSVQDLMRSR